MPTYDYRCEACGHQWEQFQSMSAAPIKRCPSCGKAKAKRLIGTGAGLIFKGSGFYITDYRDSGYKEKAKAETGGAENKSGENKTGEAKPATESSAPAKTDAPAPAPNASKSSGSGKSSAKSSESK